MTKANECTCPSGDGSLRHPCPAHPALVEQAGGDERAAFRPAQVISYRPGMGEVTIYVAGRVPGYMNIGDTVYVSDRAPVEQPSAALAQPSPKREQRLVECDACPTSGGCVEKCMKAPTQPSPAQTQPSPAPTLRAAIDVANARFEVPVAKWGTNLVGEEEQPEVVARVDGTDEDWFIQPEDETELHNEGLLFAGCELGRMIDFDRIVGALLRQKHEADTALAWATRHYQALEQERDAALARVAELELKLDQSDYAYDNDRCHMRGLAVRAIERAKVFDDGSDGADAESARSVVAILRELLAVGTAPVAQAQHSVPAYVSYTTRPAESLAGIALRQLKDESRWVEIRDINAHAFPDMQSHSYYPAGTVIKLPAAAPAQGGE